MLRSIFAVFSRKPKRARNLFLEQLEPRDCPTFGARVEGQTTIVFTGTERDDYLLGFKWVPGGLEYSTDAGDGDNSFIFRTLTVAGVITGWPPTAAFPISIKIAGLGGNDVVDLNKSRAEYGAHNMGAPGNILGRVVKSLEFDGAAGHDTFYSTIGLVKLPTAQENPHTGFKGGPGQDRLYGEDEPEVFFRWRRQRPGIWKRWL